MTAYNDATVLYNSASPLYNGFVLTTDLTLLVSGSDVTDYLADRSLSVTVGTHGNSKGTLNATLNDPATVPVVENGVHLYVEQECLYQGTVKTVDVDEYRGGHLFAKLGAANAGPIEGELPTAAPFAISDTPSGSQHGYESLSLSTRTTESGSVKTTAKLTIGEHGLWANQNVEVTSANHGLSAQEYLITEASVTWPTATSPRYVLALGDPIVKMANVLENLVLASGSITTTQISDGAISTPKLAANAVIANVANIDDTVVIDSTGIAVTSGSITVTNDAGTVVIDGTSNMFKIDATGTMTQVGTGDTTTTLTALGTGHALFPAFLNTVTHDGFESRQVGTYQAEGNIGNGAVFTPAATVFGIIDGDDSNLTLRFVVGEGVTATMSTRYYILQEAGI